MAIGTLGLGALLLGGGLAANTYVQNDRAKALGRNTRMILDNQKKKQAELDGERQELLGQALEDSAVGREEVENAQRERAAESVARMDANSRPQAPKPNAPDQAGMNGPAGRVISSATSREASDNAEETAGRRKAVADMDSLGQVLADNSRVQRPIQGEIQGNQRIAQGESDRMQLELQAAQEKAMSRKRGLEIAGQLSQGVGTGLLAGGAWGAPAASSGTTAAASAGGPGAVAGASTGSKISRIPMMVY